MNPGQDAAFEAFPEIETERLILRQLVPADAEAVLRVFGDPEVTRFYDLDTYDSIDQALDLIDFFAESFEVERSIRWGIVRKGSAHNDSVHKDSVRKNEDVVIGTCGFVWLREHRGEIGYDLARTEWRQGVMYEALDAVLEYGFDQLALNRIEALVMTHNVASAALLHALGFTEEGLLRQHDFFKGAFHDMRLFSILRSDFYAA